MLVPEHLMAVSLMEPAEGPYPPLGFVPIYDAELGNGDYYGLYWPLGREKAQPVVCDMLHDEAALALSFSSFAKFSEWLKANDYERGDEEIEDGDLAGSLFTQAQALYTSNQVAAAVELLEKACERFPEISQYWFALASQSRRLGHYERAATAALNAFHSNWVFGFPDEKVIQWLKNPKLNEYLGDDPLIRRIDELQFGFGGEKENPIYPLLKACVDEYLERGQSIKGLLLYQNYALAMYFETTAFQERYQFNLNDWRREFSALCLHHLGDNRKFEPEQ